MSDSISFYPPALAPGSNAFGGFTFGISPFGDIPAFNWLLTVISQYANSPRLLSILGYFDAAADQTGDYDAFQDNIWNILTAQGYGLDVWGRIVGVARNIQVFSGGNYFGFEQGTVWDTFGPGGQSPFYVGESLTTNHVFTDSAYRQLILTKAATNIWDGSIPGLNAILMSLFGPNNPFDPGGTCYCTDGGDMTATYTFEFDLTPLQQSIIYTSGVLPQPCGIAVSIVVP